MPIRIMQGRNHAPPIYLREWREFRELTQQQLADRLETTAATISRIENKKRDYTGAFLQAAAYALNCNPGDLISRPPSEPSIDAKLRDAPAPIRAQIAAVVETLLKSVA